MVTGDAVTLAGDDRRPETDVLGGVHGTEREIFGEDEFGNFGDTVMCNLVDEIFGDDGVLWDFGESTLFCTFNDDNFGGVDGFCIFVDGDEGCILGDNEAADVFGDKEL